MVYLPRGIALKDAFARYCGDGPRAFHRALRVDNKTVGYAVMPRCGDEAALTGTASHELLEMVTSPDTSRPGFAFVRSSSTSGFTAAGTEAMDPCGLITKETDVVEGEYVVRRAWSNRAAAAGHDPCVPAPPEYPYVALLPERQSVRLTNKGDNITIGLTAAADRPVTAWSVEAIDVTGMQQHDRYVDLDLDCRHVSPREACRLRITLRKPPATRLVVGVVSTLNTRSYLWPIEVLTR
jgi:hypothetical protein